jgi:hypothetical protein
MFFQPPINCAIPGMMAMNELEETSGRKETPGNFRGRNQEIMAVAAEAGKGSAGTAVACPRDSIRCFPYESYYPNTA